MNNDQDLSRAPKCAIRMYMKAPKFGEGGLSDAATLAHTPRFQFKDLRFCWFSDEHDARMRAQPSKMLSAQLRLARSGA